jgi:hypothetical protein
MSEDVNIRPNADEVTQVQLGEGGEDVMTDEQLAELPTQIRAGEGASTLQFDEHGEAMETIRPDANKFQMGQDDPAPTDILSTARHPVTGRPVGEITGKAVVNIGGMETSVDAAVASGYLRRTADGGYEEVGDDNLKSITEAKAEAEKAEAEAQAKHQMNLDPEHQAFMAMAEDGLGPIEVAKAVNTVLTGGEISDDTVRQYARQLGVEPEEMFTEMSGLIDSIQGEVDKWVDENGADPQSFYQYLRETTNPHELSSRINHLVNTGDMRKALGEKLNRYLQNSPDGFYRTDDSDDMIEIDGVRLKVSQARKLGLLR